MTEQPGAFATGGPLTPEHHRQRALADDRERSIRKAAKVAAFNGWVTAVLALVSVPLALFGVTALLVASALAVVAYNEFRGRGRMLRFDPAAATMLGWNQVAFLTMIVGYCLWMLYSGLTGASHLAAEVKAIPDLRAALASLGDIDPLLKRLVVVLYGSVIALSMAFQGLNAAYYFTRRKYIEAYLKETPAWVLDLQRKTAAV